MKICAVHISENRKEVRYRALTGLLRAKFQNRKDVEIVRKEEFLGPVRWR